MTKTDAADVEEAAFTRLFRNVLRDLRGHLRLRLRDDHGAEDIAQETFLRVWRNRDAQIIENPRSYLFRVANNIATDRLRERQRWQWTDDSALVETEDDASPERTVAAREELALVQRAIDRLPEDCRRAFLLRLEGASHAEIAAALGISRSMVEKHLANALVRLDKVRSSVRRAKR
jgi:RNA polymerase sigma factor (sigma-70 family)